MYVVWAVFKSHHYVDLWSMFLKVAHEMSCATIIKGIGQKIILPYTHQINLYIWSYSRIILSFSFMMIHTWLNIWGDYN
jgi:hypothetical protein